jgi:hypothetical protein
VSIINGPKPSGMWKLTESRRVKYEYLSGVQDQKKFTAKPIGYESTPQYKNTTDNVRIT